MNGYNCPEYKFPGYNYMELIIMDHSILEIKTPECNVLDC